ncbi:MAG: hypothetical protein JWQ04_1377, partial [Pedosphaera sp.]|nr:hypothetical protein [Pedosphaera sp.]
FDPRHIVALPEEIRGEVHVANETAAKLTSPQFSARRLQFDVETATPAMVTVAQTFYYPWHAYVDGKSVPLWRANHAFQALEVPAGKHSVSLVYEDRQFFAGAIVSVASLLICAVTWFWFRPKSAV